MNTTNDVIQVVRRLSHDLKEIFSGNPNALRRDSATSIAENNEHLDWRNYVYNTVYSFKAMWTLYYVVGILIAGSILYGTHEVAAIDAFLLAASAMTNSGLSPVPMAHISPQGFVVLALLMLLGNTITMLMVTVALRRYRFCSVQREVRSYYQLHAQQRQALQLTEEDKIAIAHHKVFDRALSVLLRILVVYFVSWLLLGTLLVYAALSLQPLPRELVVRGYSALEHAGFLALSAFTTTGLTLTSDSLVSLAHQPLAYLPLSLLIMAGNVASPIFLRLFVQLHVKLEHWLAQLDPRRNRRKDIKLYRRALHFILTHPRKLTTHLFDPAQTFYLGLMLALFIIMQYVFFLASTLNRPEALESNTQAQLVGIGYFQTLGTRTSGFTMMDLRALSQGLLLVYLVMMYLSVFPLVSTIHGSQESSKLTSWIARHDSRDHHVSLAAYGHDISKPETQGRDRELRLTHLMTSRSFKRSLSIETLCIPTCSVRRTSLYFSSDRQMGTHDDDGDESLADPESDELPSSGSHKDDDDLSTPPLPCTVPEMPAEDDSKKHTKKSTDTVSCISVGRTEHLGFLDSQLLLEHNKHDLEECKKHTIDSSDESDKETDVDECLTPGLSERTEQARQRREREDEELRTLQRSFATQFLLRHSFVLLMAAVVLAYSEESLMMPQRPVQTNLFYVFFELVSAYGNIGLSVGVPGQSYSLIGAFSMVGKLVIFFVMILGKHRGLPSSSDEVIDYQFIDYQRAWHYDRHSCLTM